VASRRRHHRVALFGGEADQESLGEGRRIAHDVLHATGRW
jgi:hypothetical protein